MFQIPDSPLWLLNEGRNADALKALCWLRGWVSTDRVQLEYKNMSDYIETSNLSNLSRFNYYCLIIWRTDLIFEYDFIQLNTWY